MNQNPPTDEQLNQIEARAGAATPGPWERYEEYGPTFYANVSGEYLRGVGDFNFGVGEQADADEAFVRHAPEDVRVLLAEVRRLRDELATASSERDCLAMAVLFASQWTPQAPMSLREGIDEILATMPGAERASGPVSDTLPAWLYQRFMPHGEGWDRLDDEDRAYWEHQARAVRRAVARGGFKPAASASAVAVSGGEQ